jgi:hypothetical protein
MDATRDDHDHLAGSVGTAECGARTALFDRNRLQCGCGSRDHPVFDHRPQNHRIAHNAGLAAMRCGAAAVSPGGPVGVVAATERQPSDEAIPNAAAFLIDLEAPRDHISLFMAAQLTIDRPKLQLRLRPPIPMNMRAQFAKDGSHIFNDRVRI